MDPAHRNRIVRSLSAESSALRAEGVQAALDFVLDQRLSDLVDWQAAQRVVLEALTSENLLQIIGRHVQPGWERYSKVAALSKQSLGELIPAEAQDRIRKLIATHRPPRFAWARGAVDPALVRKLLAPVFADVLGIFVRRLPIPGFAGSADASAEASARDPVRFAERLTRRVQKRTGQLASVGLSAMGGLGAELEKRLQIAARDFGSSAVEGFGQALRARLRSDEGRALVDQIIEQIVTRTMKTPIARLHEDAARLPVPEILALVPDIVAHAAPLALVREIVEAELRAFLDAEGERPLADVLAELGVLSEVREIVEARVDALARQFFASDAFTAWLDRVLDSA